MRRKIVALTAVAGLAGAAGAQSYSIIAFDDFDDTLKLVNVPGGNPPAASVSNLFTFADPDTRILSIDRLPGGAFIFDNSPFPPTNPNKAGVLRIDNLFSAPALSVIADGDPRFTLATVRYDAGLDQILTVQNPSSDHPQPRWWGVLGVTPDGSTITEIFQEASPPPPRPFWRRATDMVKELNSDDYLVVAMNGGIFDDPNGGLQPPDRNFGSTLHRLTIDPNTLQGTETLVVDLSDTAVTGLADPITFARGIDINPNNGDVYVADGNGDIWRVELDVNGNFASVSSIVSGFGATRPGGVRYNPFNDTIIFTTALGNDIWQVNTDGTNLQLVIDNINVGGIYIIPAPASVALLGLAGLVATRRRR